MANLVVKSNSANQAFNVSQKVFKLPFSENKVELVISAKNSYMVSAKDFKAGLLTRLILLKQLVLTVIY